MVTKLTLCLVIAFGFLWLAPNIIVSTKIQLDVKSGQVGFWAEIKVTSVQDFGHGT